MTIKLTIKFNATDDVWYAYDGATENDSRHIGQGCNPEAACSDYWYQAHGSAAELIHDADNDRWLLEQGSWRVVFDTKQDAVNFANAREWQIEGRL